MRQSMSAVMQRAKRLLYNKLFRWILPWVVILGFFVFWELFVIVFHIEQFVLPAPTAIFAAAWNWHWLILENAGQTFMTTAIGFFVAIAFGLAAGVAVGSS